MAQIQSPETYADGQQVTASRLNNQTNGAVLLPGAVTDQTALAAGTVASGDGLIVHDASASALRKTTAGDLLGSGVPITTGAITGSTGADLVITPAAGQKVDIAGNLEADDINVTDDLTVGDDATISGDLIVTGGSTLTGNVIADNGFTSNGVANFTGTLQVNGTVGYVLTEVVEQTMTPWTAPSAGSHWGVFTSAAFTKPVGEIWVFEVSFRHQSNRGVGGCQFAGRYGSVAQGTGAYIFHDFFFDGSGGSYLHHNTYTNRWVADASTTFTSETFKIDADNGGSSLALFQTTVSAGFIVTSVTSSKFRIYKYKTA